MSDYKEVLARAGAVLFSGISGLFALGAVSSIEVAYGFRRLASLSEAYLTGIREDPDLYRLVSPWVFFQRVIGIQDPSSWLVTKRHADEWGSTASDSQEEVATPEEDQYEESLDEPNPEVVTSSRECSSEVSH